MKCLDKNGPTANRFDVGETLAYQALRTLFVGGSCKCQLHSRKLAAVAKSVTENPTQNWGV
jgi:hypothetical protein